MTAIQKPDINRLHDRLKRAHSVLSRHPETCLYGGVMLMGDSVIVEKPMPYTACTDGRNKFYGMEFMANLTDPEVNAIVLHENLHVGLRHIPRFATLLKKHPREMNQAMDFVVNGIIMRLKDKALCKLPEGGCYDPKYDGWSVIEVFEDLMRKKKDEPEKEKGRGKCEGEGEGEGTPGDGPGTRGDGEPYDEHDVEGYEKLTEEEAKKLSDEVSEALQAGGIIAGRLGADIPREIDEAAQAEQDWKRELSDFVSNVTRGQDEYTWRKMNRRWLASDVYRPSVISETVGEVVVAIDTSGSIGGGILSRFAAELASICEACSPERVRVLWWDVRVHGEQVFEEGQYGSICKLLKPVGGGGTNAQCVPEYIAKKNLNAECVIVLTDGYFMMPDWNITMPTIWFVLGNTRSIPTGHRIVQCNRTQFD